MAITHKSQTEKQSKDYWRAGPELVNEAQKLLKIRWFSIDVCVKDRNTSIGLSTAYIDENIDALSPTVNWYEHHFVKNKFIYSRDLPMFCNPPFSKKWQFFSKADITVTAPSPKYINGLTLPLQQSNGMKTYTAKTALFMSQTVVISIYY